MPGNSEDVFCTRTHDETKGIEQGDGSKINHPALKWDDLLFEAADDDVFPEFDQIYREVCLGMRPDLDNFAGVAGAGEKRSAGTSGNDPSL